MNAPFLPPLAPHPAPGTAPRIAVDGDVCRRWQAGFGGLAGDNAEPFVRPCDPLGLADPSLFAVSDPGARLLGLCADEIKADPRWLSLLSGNAVASHLQPYSAVYAGHQFGVFVARLGDGRALNLGSINGWELQLKGAGPTPYSRFADGRAVLRSSIREFLCSEAMAGLGIPTTRVLSLVLAPQQVLRETVETAGIVCRLSPHWIRIGHFEYFAAQDRSDLNEKLLRWVWPQQQARHQPDDTNRDTLPTDRLALAFLEDVARKTAELMAHWMAAGFMHGVMNTDNFSVLGLTLDYGPFGFMESYDSGHICNHSDHEGRYAYGAQPQVGLYNVSRLAGALFPLVKSEEKLQDVLDAYKSVYAERIDTRLRQKFGLSGLDRAEWEPLLQEFYGLLAKERMDYTLAFRALASPLSQGLLELVSDSGSLKPWIARYQEACRVSDRARGITEKERHRDMNAVNPRFVLRNWVAEHIIRDVRDRGDRSSFDAVITVLANPYDEHPGHEHFGRPAPDWAKDLSVSCSS